MIQPTHVKNKIIFNKDEAKRVYKAVCPEGKFSFAKLIPTPHKQFTSYKDDVNSEATEKWVQWNIKHWGTKYPAFDQAIGLQGEKAYIAFDTMHNIASPVIARFAKLLQVPFEHRYIHEGFLFWGIEVWGKTPATGDEVWRMTMDRGLEKHKRDLCIELLGYDPEGGI
jgi:hypothetical protein